MNDDIKNPLVATESAEAELGNGDLKPMPVSSKGHPTDPLSSRCTVRSIFKNVLISVLISSILAAMTFFLVERKDISLSNILHQRGNTHEQEALSVTITNEYSVDAKTMFDYPFLEDALLIEPYRDSNLTITGGDEDYKGCDYTWVLASLKGNQKSSGISDQSLANIHPRLPTGQYELTIENTCSQESATFNVWIKYVRRELMSLTHEDRELFLDAMATLWSVSTLDGQKLYGDRYKSVYYFAAIHNDAGANSVCDEFHGDSGFINNHVIIGAYLEQSLRLVNPRVSLHYMEYTKYFSSTNWTNHLLNQMDGGAWTELLTEKWFGSNDPHTGRIVDGRWANCAIPVVDDDFYEREGVDKDATFFPEEQIRWEQSEATHLSSPYGLLRSPWNFSPSNYTLRFNNVNEISYANVTKKISRPYQGSACGDYKTLIETTVVNQPLTSYLKSSQDQAHGYIHFTFGGAGGQHVVDTDELLKHSYGFDDNDLMVTTLAAQTFFKMYVPAFFTNSREDSVVWCTSSVDQWNEVTGLTAANCTCNTKYFEDEDSLTDLIDLFFKTYLNDPDNFEIVSKIPAMDFETRKTVMKLICERQQFDGDMAGSGAAADPLFWVAHGAVERLFQRIMFEDVLSDTNYATIGPTGCSGHDGNSTKAWLKGFYFEDATIEATNVTNAEMLDILDPRSDLYRDLINFVYEDDSWDWCDGFDDWFSYSA